MITLSNVGKSYGHDVTIGPVDLTIPEGGITALVGPNGAGKSTLLIMIGRLLGIDSGHIEVAGYDVAKTKSKDLAKIIAILRQENHFIARLTVRQLVGFSRFPYSQGGQRQRAYVAMVLAQDTEYVLLDEPLNNLDMKHSVQMMRHLKRAAQELGRTIIIVLHDINFAGHYADHICAVKEGQVTEFGTPAEILTDSVLTRIFDTPVQVIDGPNGALAVYY